MRVAIIGCGVAGGYLGMRLAQRGEDVTIIERKVKTGGKACSGLVSERIWEHVPENESIVENRIEAVVLHFPKRSISAVFRPGMLALNRSSLDAYIARLAQEAGASLVLGSSFEGLWPSGRKVTVRYGGKEVVFDRVVGCDGAISRVRSHFEHREPRYRAGIQCFEPKKDNGSKAESWPTPDGFFWKIPKGAQIEWGLFERKEVAGKMWKEFAEKHSLAGLKTQSAVIPEGVCVTKSDRVTVCGDAAGLTKPWSGGGILWGIASVNLLFDAWPDIPVYEKKLKRIFGKRMFIGRLAARTVSGMGNRLPWLVPKRVSFDSDWIL